MKQVPVGINTVGKIKFMIAQAEEKGWGEAYKTALLIALEKTKIINRYNEGKKLSFFKRFFGRKLNSEDDFLLKLQILDAQSELDAAQQEMQRLEQQTVDYDSIQRSSSETLAAHIGINAGIHVFAAMSGLPEPAARALYDASCLDKDSIPLFMDKFSQTINTLDAMAKTASLPASERTEALKNITGGN